MHKKYQIGLWCRQLRDLCCFLPLEMFLFKNQCLWKVMIKQKQQFTLLSVPRLSSYFHKDSIMLSSQGPKMVKVCITIPFYRETRQSPTKLKWFRRFPLCWSPDIKLIHSAILLYTYSTEFCCRRLYLSYATYVIGSGVVLWTKYMASLPLVSMWA